MSIAQVFQALGSLMEMLTEKESEPALGSAGSLVGTLLCVDSVSDDCCLADFWQ